MENSINTLIYCDQPHNNWYEHIYSSYYHLSPHNSKHMFDIYTNTHVFWQMLLMWMGKKVFPNHKDLIATILFFGSTLFEIYENQPEQIKLYRRIEINSSGKTSYRGDSIINNVGDVLGNILGIYLGYVLDDELTIIILLLIFVMITFVVGIAYWTDFFEFSYKTTL